VCVEWGRWKALSILSCSVELRARGRGGRAAVAPSRVGGRSDGLWRRQVPSRVLLSRKAMTAHDQAHCRLAAKLG
jgi:hypothetical protein